MTDRIHLHFAQQTCAVGCVSKRRHHGRTHGLCYQVGIIRQRARCQRIASLASRIMQHPRGTIAQAPAYHGTCRGLIKHDIQISLRCSCDHTVATNNIGREIAIANVKLGHVDSQVKFRQFMQKVPVGLLGNFTPRFEVCFEAKSAKRHVLAPQGLDQSKIDAPLAVSICAFILKVIIVNHQAHTRVCTSGIAQRKLKIRWPKSLTPRRHAKTLGAAWPARVGRLVNNVPGIDAVLISAYQRRYVMRHDCRPPPIFYCRNSPWRQSDRPDQIMHVYSQATAFGKGTQPVQRSERECAFRRLSICPLCFEARCNDCAFAGNQVGIGAVACNVPKRNLAAKANIARGRGFPQRNRFNRGRIEHGACRRRRTNCKAMSSAHLSISLSLQSQTHNAADVNKHGLPP